MTSLDRIINVTFEIMRLMRHQMSGISKDHLQVNFLQIHALAMVNEHEGMTMKELADALRVTSPSATSFVNRLVKLQWIERHSDATNRKLVRLRVTAAGKKMLKENKELRVDAIRNFFQLLSTDEQDELARLLEKLHSLSLSQQKKIS